MNRKGFSLVEVLVALVIFAVGILAVIQMSYIYIQTNAANHKFSQAVTVAQTKMDELRRMATSDRQDNFAPFDFDYLISTAAQFGSVFDPVANADIAVPGFLHAGPVANTPWGAKFGNLGTGNAMSVVNGVYTNEDEQSVLLKAVTPSSTDPILNVYRRWSVQPEPDPGNVPNFRPQYAVLTVEGKWTDKQGEHSTRLESCVFRRQ